MSSVTVTKKVDYGKKDYYQDVRIKSENES